jgi:hypothetical protein
VWVFQSIVVCAAGVIVMLSAAVPARAESKAEVAIAKAIDAAFDPNPSFGAEVVVIGPGGTIGRGASQRDYVSHRIGDERLNGMMLHLAAVEAPTISVDEVAGIAWFSFSADVFDTYGRVPLRGLDHRVTGMAVRDGATWKLATFMIANLIPDKDLYAHAWKREPTAPVATGELKLAATVSEWFTTGLGVHAVTSPPPIVAGSAVAEHGAGATAARLVKAWDALKLRPTEFEARVFGKLAVVSGEVALPHKDEVALLGFTVFLVAAKSGWQWVAIQFSALPD